MPKNYAPRILYIDAYDSFANNIVCLVQASIDSALPVEVETIKHDDQRFSTSAEFASFLQYFDAVIAGPGPGDPRNDEDVGVIRFLWSLENEIPILGICLGFQSMCRAFGGTVQKLKEPRHGIVRPVKHTGQDIFQDTQEFHVTSYHSLYVTLNKLDPDSVLQPLAWDPSDRFNGEVVMAVKHISKPIWAVQYHPESICTSPEGQKIISAWCNKALQWNLKQNRQKTTSSVPPPPQQRLDNSHHVESSNLADIHLRLLQQLDILRTPLKLSWSKIHAPEIDIISLCDKLNISTSQAILLKSGRSSGHPLNEQLGRFSIIGIMNDSPVIKLQYTAKERNLCLNLEQCNTSDTTCIASDSVSDVWSYIKRFMDCHQVKDGPSEIPFWGGLVGYVSYEAGLETIAVEVQHTMQSFAPAGVKRPDINFVFVERSIVVDHLTNVVYILNLKAHDPEWQARISDSVKASSMPSGNITNALTNGYHRVTKSPRDQINKVSQIQTPEREQYLNKIAQCDRHIRDGDSYELCLIDQTKISTIRTNLTPQQSGWNRFKHLSTRNPAPFSAYMRLQGSSDGLTIVGSSPERFLSWSRQGTCQFRPIKGTVKKGPNVTYDDAALILNSSKERAENLMITDLIRHDLHGVVGAGNVSVPKLMQIEEYATVYQLVSVIEGKGLKSINDTKQKSTGIDVLAASLPPGSMTGAPKKRSCELLADIELNKPRGIYSGVIGYLDVGGGGDFSVVIRTAYRWDSDNVNGRDQNGTIDTLANGAQHTETEYWTVGAGGAITAQSDPEGEYTEMLTKLSSVLGAFD